MTTIRTRVRYSVLAALVSYLRDGVQDTSKFTTLENVAGTYPTTQRVWSFLIDANLYQIRALDAEPATRSAGVTLYFYDDTPDSENAMPQAYTLDAKFSVVVPIASTGESFARKIAQKIDEALWRLQGRLEIKDYDVTPPVSMNPQAFVGWQKVPRGKWSSENKGYFETLDMDVTFRYSIPRSEW